MIDFIQAIIKKFVKFFFNLFGFGIYKLKSDELTKIFTGKGKVKFDVMFDIGANTGQFSLAIRNKGYKGKIVSFEPLTAARKKLVQNASKDVNWFVHDQAAIGESNGFVDINISKNSVSSSILPMLNLHSEAEASSVYIGHEKVPIITLDSISNFFLGKSENCFIKIDTQGYEAQVLDGAMETLKSTNGILCELSLFPLYKGQKLWKEIINKLEDEGFILWSFEKAFVDIRDGRTLQIDAVFLKKTVIN
jgi:FkbM family methyltransferase